MKQTAVLLTDFYKIGHVHQYQPGTEVIYSTWTARQSRINGIDDIVFYGLQGFIKEYLVDYFNGNFFGRPLEDVISEYDDYCINCLFIEKPINKHIADLHALGYLPIEVKAVKEGTKVPIRVPVFTVKNTIDKFYWVTNALETLISTEMWSGITTATIANKFRNILDDYAIQTTGSTAGVEYQGHDFSFRGMSGVSHGAKAGGGHLLSFLGTDTIPAIDYLKKYYYGDITMGGIGCSVPATEHSVMCANMPENRDEAVIIEDILTRLYPSGICSMVCDTFDFWNTVTVSIPKIKDIIMARDGKFVVRPDSGDPVLILCGDSNASTEAERKGLVEVLWDEFGGTTTEQGYKLMESHIGCIYGDAITIDRCVEICARLMLKGFASTNVVLGVGSYSYNMNSRDTFGQAFKSTYAEIYGVPKMLFKDPKTDDGTKKSQKGIVAVYKHFDKIRYVDELSIESEKDFTGNLLELVFKNGKVLRVQTLSEIRDILKN